MARRRKHVDEILKEIDRLSEMEQCELLEEMLLRHRDERSGHGIDRMRARFRGVGQRQLKRAIDSAVAEVRRANSRPAH